MKKLQILKINGLKHYLKDKDNNETYELNLTFLNIKTNPQVDDEILINDALLDPSYVEYSNSYIFGPIDQPYGRKITSKEQPDLIAVKIKGEKMFLKRFFG